MRSSPARRRAPSAPGASAGPRRRLADPPADLVVELGLVTEHEPIDPVTLADQLELREAGDPIRHFSQEPQANLSFRGRETPANRTHTMNAILDFVATCSNAPYPPTSATHAS